MKKLLSLALILVLSLSILVGCGGSGTSTEEGSAEPITVGFIYVGPVGDGGFTDAHDKGRLYLEEQMGDKVKTIYQESVPETMQDVKNAAKIMIDEGASIIFGTSFGFMDAIEELAKEYPDVKFMHFSGYKKNDTNFGNYFGAMEEARYLSGIVAGMKTESNKIGFVGAFPLTELFIGINAFTLGAQSVNPDATVQVIWTNSWYDPAKEKEAAEALLAAGCDVIAQHCDTTGPQVAAQDKGVWAIGYNSDTAESAPEAFMTAPVWNHGIFYVQQVQAIIDGTWTPQSYYGNLADGYINLLELTGVAPEGAKEKIEEVKAQMVAGEFNPFTGEIKDQAGNIVVAKGEKLDREKIWQMNYLVQGVEGTTK